MPTIVSIAEQQGENQRTALYYAVKFRWRVFPVHSIRDGRCTCGKNCSSPGKHPLTANGLHDATTDPAIIRAWWHRWPWANIGIATGAGSGFFVLDVDGDVGQTTLDGYETKHGRLPDTVEAITGGGGRHILFQHPGFDIRNVVRLAPGLDIRGDGGYIVAPPSVHRSGRQYEWELSSRPDEVEIAPAPTWLLDMLRHDRATKTQAAPASEWQALAQGVAEGGRNNAITRIAGHLLRRYVNPSLTLQLILAWNNSYCFPPLPATEVIKTVDSVAKMELRRRQGGAQRGRWHV